MLILHLQCLQNFSLAYLQLLEWKYLEVGLQIMYHACRQEQPWTYVRPASMHSVMVLMSTHSQLKNS